MTKSKPESRLVRRVMPDASEAERQAATDRWYRFLNILCDIAQREEVDSPNSSADATVEEQTKCV